MVLRERGVVMEVGARERRRLVVMVGVQNAGGEVRRRLIDRRHLEVHPAEDGAVAEAEMIAFGEGEVAGRAREAVHVEDELARAHHQLRREDRRLTFRAPFHAEQSIIILFTINVPVARKTRNLPVERVPTLTTLQTSRVPPTIDRRQVIPIGNAQTAAGAARGARVLRLRVNVALDQTRLDFRNVMFDERRMRSAKFGRRVRGRRVLQLRRRGARRRPTNVGAARLMVVIRRRAARTAARWVVTH